MGTAREHQRPPTALDTNITIKEKAALPLEELACARAVTQRPR
jgi:hypothetical protein